MSKTLPPNFQSALDDWQNALTFQNYAKYTVATYGQAVAEFGLFLVGRGCDDWTACRRVDITAYFAQRIENGLQISSAKLYQSAISQFFEWLKQTHPALANFAKTHRIRGKSERLPKLLDVDLVAKLLDLPPPTKLKEHKLWTRDRAMFELIYSSGLRVGELVRLDRADVDVLGRLVQVMGKGSKERIVPMGRKACQAIQAYLPIRDEWATDATQNGAMFVSERGGRLTARSVQYRLEKWATQAGISQNLHPHLLRHAFASHMLSSSGDLRAIQEMLGHESLATTQIYTHLDFGAIANLYDKAHPRAKNNEKETL